MKKGFKMAILIKNGTVVNAGGIKTADVLISEGVIKKTGKNLNDTDNEVSTIIDAKGKYLFPGGIDPHVHMHLPTPAGFSADDFLSGSRAALAGGTTTLIDFVTPQKGEPLCDALEKRKKEAANCLTDYSFHVSPVEWRKTLPREIKNCIAKGLTSFKVYMAYKDTIGLDDFTLLRVMEAVSHAGGTVTVHCEDGDEIEKLRNSFHNEGKLSPRYHPLSRPANLEASAVKKVMKYAARTNCNLYIVHVSSELSLQYIKEGQKKGENVYAETCPQYLLLNNDKYSEDFELAAPYVMSPPLRTSDDNAALWNALKEKTIKTVATDHCPFNMEQKRRGLHDFRKIANGAGGVEHRLTLLFTYGVLTNKITLTEFVELTSTNAAKIFGIYPKKGVIAKGSDADIVIWNPEIKKTISAENHLMNCDNDIFDGFGTTGAPQTVIKNGEIVYNDGKLSGNISPGHFLYRNKSYF